MPKNLEENADRARQLVLEGALADIARNGPLLGDAPAQREAMLEGLLTGIVQVAMSFTAGNEIDWLRTRRAIENSLSVAIKRARIEAGLDELPQQDRHDE